MGLSSGGTATLVAVSLAVGCSPALVQEAAAPGKAAHDRTVEDLERRVGEEEGWVVLPLPNVHEGGGLTTWWLHPCDPDRDDDRRVTRTAYHGSDVATLPGTHQVETDRLPCRAPSRDVEVAGRHLTLDVDAVHLGGSTVALLADRDRVEIADAGHGTTREAAALARPIHGPCDGRTHWVAALDSDRELTVHVSSCVGTLAALPDEARRLLDLPAGAEAHRTSSGPLPAEHHRELLEALLDAGFDPDDADVLEVDDPGLGSLWRGPCGPTAEPRRDGDTQTLVDVHAGHVTVSERACR